MSQSGKRFLSGLVNRVMSSNTKESRSAAKRRERSLSSRRLGMEPLEDRQLLAVDPTLLSAAAQAEVAQSENVAAQAVDLSALQQSAATVIANTGVGVAISVDGSALSNAASEDTTGTHRINADIVASIADRPISCSEMTWAATLSNMLTYNGWSTTSIVDPEAEGSAAQQTFDYFANSFTNDPSNLALAYAWFMNGPAEYTLQGNDAWAQILPNSTNGGLFPSASGDWQDPSAYCKEFLASEIASPLYGISTDYLDNNWSVGLEIHYSGPTGEDVETGVEGQAKATWLTFWGYDYDSSFTPQDQEYYTAIYVSNAATGKIERHTIGWSDVLNSYVLTDYDSNVSGQVPYIYSFTVVQRMPGYGVLTPDQYEPNNTVEAFEVENPSDLGNIDVVVPSATTGSAVNGNVLKLENLTLYAQGSEDGETAADPVDYYKFNLTQTASHSDFILVEFGEGYLNSPLKATLYVCGDDGEAYPVDPMEYGYVGDHFDAVASSSTSYYVGEDGKTYAEVTNKLRIDMSGLTAGSYYLKIEFADGIVGGVNQDYSITFNAGFDDLYESNDSFEEVNALPVDRPNNPTANFGVLYGRKFVDDLVLKQYDHNISETDWFRFEMAATGGEGSAVNLYYKSTASDINDADLDFVLYREDPDDVYGRGYTMVDRSWQIMTDVETVSLEGLEAGVYYIKVVGNLAAEDGVFVNVEYKLEILPGVDENLPPDLRSEVLAGNNWEGPLVVAVDRYVPSETEQFKSESTVGPDGNVYLNYSFAVYGVQTAEKTAEYENVTLGLYINGVKVSVDDMRAAILAGGLVDSKAVQMLDLFCNGGMTMKAGESFEFINFNIGKIANSESLAGKYFDGSTFAPNSVVVLINPDNYELGEDFGKVVDKQEVTELSLTYVDGSFMDGSKAVTLSKGQEVKVYRNNKLVKTFKYGVDDFDMKNGDVAVAAVVKHNYSVNVEDYEVKDGVLGVLEFMVDNNCSSAMFILDNLQEDVFAPNGSVSDVMNNTNPEGENPDLGVVNIEYLDQEGVCHIDNLVVTGAKDDNGAYLSDWFKFQLLTSQEDAAKGQTNYEDAYVRIDMDPDYTEANDPSDAGDLDLYLYKVVQTDPTVSFDEAFEAGSYRLSLIATSKDVTASELINFKDVEGIDDGTYFIRVAGFNGASNRYSLEVGGFTNSGDIIPTDPNEYFTEDNVAILNSVATLNWRVPTTDYVSRVYVSYRAEGAEEWTEAGNFKSSVTSCKIAGLDPNTKYEFKLSVTNFFIQDDPLSATVVKKTADYLNEVVYRAVIVGVSDYPGASADLVAAANDAQAFKNALLQDPQWAEENITLLTNDNATKANVLDAIASIGYVSDDNDVVVFYFAGSGTSAVTGGAKVGYLKTYGSVRASYLSSSELMEAMSAVSAGSKQFILDAGQVAAGLEDTAINYDAFINSLTGMTKNGDSDRVAQVSVLTSGENGAVSPVGQGSRSVFSQTLVDAIDYYRQVLTQEEADAANKDLALTDKPLVESDGRVAVEELAEFINNDIRIKAYEMSAMNASNTEGEQAIMMNGFWSESDAYAQDWLDADAIVVTTTVDTVDDHDGKVSLREASNLLGTVLNRETELSKGDKFTLKAGSTVTVGASTGVLVEDVELTYSAGSFKTAGVCSLEIGTKIVDFNKTGNVVAWGADDFAAGNVKLEDANGLAVADVEYKLEAIVSSSIVDKEEYNAVVKLEEGDVLYTAAVNGKEGVVTKVGQNYRVLIDGVPYNKTTGLYRKTIDEEGQVVFESVTLANYVVIDQDVVMKKIVFADTLAGQSVTVNTEKGAIVFEQGAIIDATSLKGELTFDGKGENTLLDIQGSELVSLVGVKIVNANGSAIKVAEGADFELANSLVVDNNAGSDALFAVDGNMTLTNVTIANNVASAIAAGAGTVAITNTIVALNDAAITGFAFDSTSYVGGKDDNPGFNGADKGDYTLVKSSDAVDIGDNSAVNLRCGLVLDYDLSGDDRYSLGGTIDAGCFEYAVPEEDRETPSTVVTILEDIVDPTDNEISLREAIAYAGTTYKVETSLAEGDVVVDANGVKYEVRNGRLVSFDGVTAIQYGQYYTVEGVYIVDAYGEAATLEDGEVVSLANGTKVTVVGTKLQYASGLPVEAGVAITRADGTTGTLSYGAVVDFARNQQISVDLTAAKIDPATPVSTFDAGTYTLTYQLNGMFKATLKVTTTNDQNQSETTEFEATFKLVAGTDFNFIDEEGEITDAGKIAAQRNVDLENGKYTLVEPLTEKIDGKTVVIYAAGAQFTLTDGVFTDADGYVVALPKATKLYAPSGIQVAYQMSVFTPATLEEGAELVCEDGVTRQYKDGLNLYEEVTLGKNITFKKGLEGGTVSLEKGAIVVERAVTLDAALNSGLTIDAHNDSRVFTVNTYRESNPSATVVMNGLTLINGNAEEGGLVYVAAGSNFKLTDSTLSDSTATKGGAIFNAGKATFEAASKPASIANTSAQEGGAIYNVGTFTATNATIDSVSADNGGAIYNKGVLSLGGGSVTNATANENGGALYNAGTATISKGVNIANATAVNGAAAYNAGTLNVVNATLQNNVASQSGAAVYNEGKASLTAAKVIGNSSASYGGAIYDAAQFFATRTVFAENVSGNSGNAVYSCGNATIVSSLVLANGEEGVSPALYALMTSREGKLSLVNDTIVGNKNGGVYAYNGSVTMYNSVVGQNGWMDFAALNAIEADAKYNMVEKSDYALDSTNVEYAPNFKSFDPATAWTEWQLMPASGSAAIDMGSVEYAYYYNFNGAKTALTVDFLGNSRVNGEGVDIGAYEAANISEDSSTVVTTLDDIVDPTDGLISLREAIRYASTGKTVADRTVTFSNDLFPLTNDASVKLSADLQTIVIGSAVTVTAEYVDEFGEVAYRNITIDGSEADAPLFMLVDGAEVEMRGFTFTGGHATGENNSGGAFIVRGGELSLVDAVITGNTADRNGGAISQTGGSIFIVDSLIVDNAANKVRGYGGAICQTGGQAYVYNTTIAANDAAVYGGIFSNDGLLVLANSIVAQNGGAQSVDVYATNIEATANLIGAMDSWRSVNGLNGNIVGTPLNVADPLFVDPENGDFHLQNGSLAVNAGVNAYAYGPDGVRLKYDLDANDRIIGGVVDMGCYESGMADVPSTVVTTLRDVVDQEDGVVSLREAIEYAKQYGTPITFDLGEDYEGDSTIYLDSERGAIDVTSNLVIDASNLPEGLTIVGSDDRVFFVHKSGSILEDGTQTTEDGVLSLKNVALTGGNASRGGAVFMDGGEVNFTNVLIYGNSADEGGAVYAAAGKVTLLNCTVANNEADDIQGIYCAGSLTLQNTIVAENASELSAADHNVDVYVTGKLSSVASIVGSADAATVAAQNGYNGNVYGTPEEMVDPGFVAGESNDFTLEQDSIAINAGSNRLVGQPGYYASILQTASNTVVVKTDFAGADRIVGGTVDIGAYEFQVSTETPSVVVTTLLDVVDPFDGLISLREAIDYAGSSYYVDGVQTKVGRTITFDPALTNGVIKLEGSLAIEKCVTIDASNLAGTLTLDAGQTDDEFAALVLKGQADSVADTIYVIGLSITGGKAEYGAGVYHVTGKAKLINCVVYGNEGVYGAGVASVAEHLLGEDDANVLTLSNVTVTKNNSTGAYGGVWSIGSGMVLHNTLIAKNTTNGQEAVDVSISSVNDMKSSLIGAASNSFARNYAETSNLVGTAANPIDPVFADFENNDFALARTAEGKISPAVNMGDNTLLALPDGSISVTDAGENLRVIGGIVDIGAYESVMGPSEIPSTLVTTLADVVDAYDGLISLREAVAYANNYGLGDTITFAEALSGGTLYLDSQLVLNNDITIDGLANGVVGLTLTTADAVNDQSVIYMNSGNVIINGITITNRYSERLQVGETLEVAEGGAIYVRAGSISVYNSLIADNAAEAGSAIYINAESDSATVTLVNCTVVNNTGLVEGDQSAAIYSPKGVLNLWNTIVAANKVVGGATAQDVFKGNVKTAGDTVVERNTMNVQTTEFELAPREFVNGDTVTYDYNTLTFEDGVFYRYYGTAYQEAVEFNVGAQVQVKDSVQLTYQNNGWFINGVIYSIDCEAGDQALYYDASTGKTTTVYYQYGEFRKDGKSIAFNVGDKLTVPERNNFSYQEDGFHRVNVTTQSSGWWRREYVLQNAAQVELAQQVLETLRAALPYQRSYTKMVNGVEVTYPILSANVEITGYSADVSQAEGGYNVNYSYTATYTYVTQSGVTVFNSFVSLSDTLGNSVSGNGSFIGTTENDLLEETAHMFVDLENGNYNLVDSALATNAGDLSYLNQSQISGTFSSKDIEGKSRVYYTTIDMGAFENQTAKDSPVTSVVGTSISLTVTTGRDVVDPSDGLTSMREALTLASQLATRGYDNITINVAGNYNIRVDSSLGTFSIDAPLTINGNACTIDADSSACGFIVNTDGPVTLSDVIITNGVSGQGAGVKLVKGDLTLNNCLIYDCEATTLGGAVYAGENTSLKLYNTTIAKNVAVTGSGLYGEASAKVDIYNSIVAKNRSSVTGQIETDVMFAGNNFSVNYSLIGNAGDAANAAKLEAKASNSLIGYGFDNSVDPKFMGETEGNFRISATGSPAKNAASSAFILTGSQDLDGNRLYTSPLISMGAYQVGTEARSTVVTTAEDVVDSTDGLISLREAIMYAEDNIHGAGCSKPYNSSYAATNAMNDPNVYRATYYSPITFDQSLAGQTIVLNSALNFNRTTDSGTLYDYLIDGSSLSSLANGGITIDCSNAGGAFGLGAAFNVSGRGDTTNNVYWPTSLDIRNVTIVGNGGTAFATNNYGIVTLRNCLVEGFNTCVSVSDNDSDQAGLAHIYNSTLLGDLYVGGPIYMYNSILTGNANIPDTQNDPGYRYVHAYSSFIYGYNGLNRFDGDSRPSWQNVPSQFVDYYGGNYHLAEGSLCVNRGNNAYVQTLQPTHGDPEVDADGNGRIVGGVVDMGCYEAAGIYDIPSTVVTTDLDVVDYADGVISLREAIVYAQQGLGGNTVTFSDDLDGATIYLDGAVSIASNVSIDGGAHNITLDGAQNGSVIDIEIGGVQANVPNVYLRNMTLTGGYTNANGGAINITSGNVYVQNLDIWGNTAVKYGGAIYAYDSELTIDNCRIGGNVATYYGGVVNEFGKTVLTHSYVAENSAVIVGCSADLWGRAATNYVNSKNNVVGSVAANIKLYDKVDNNRIGTATDPIKPFVSAATGNLTVQQEWIIDDATDAVLDEAFAELFNDELDIEL